MRVKLRGLNHVRKLLADGSCKDYWFAWKGKGAPPLPGKPGSPEFIAAYNEAIASKGSAARNETVLDQTALQTETLGWLLAKFLGSQHFNKFDERTRSHYGWIAPSIEKEFGDLPLEAVKDRRTRAVFIEWRDSIAAGTCKTLVSRRRNRARLASASMADLHLQKLAAILSWGVKQGWIDINPCTAIERLHHGSRLDK